MRRWALEGVAGMLVAALSLFSSTAASLADEIDRECRARWGADRDMVGYCVENKRRAKREVGAFSGSIRRNCEREWGTDYGMVIYCIRNQTESLSNLRRLPDDGIARHCRDKWGDDFDMVEYCDGNQRSAKRVLEQSWSGSPARARCERKWGVDYEMILYCIRH